MTDPSNLEEHSTSIQSLSSEIPKKDFDEEAIVSHPWALQLMRNVKKVTKQSILKWSSCVIRLGAESVNVDEWTTIFSGQVEKTYEDLIADVWNLEDKVLNKNQELLASLESICRDLRIEMPLLNQNKSLYETQRFLMQINEEYEIKRKIKVKEFDELRNKQMELCKALDKEPLLLKQSPLPTKQELDCLRSYIERLEQENFERIEKCFQLKKDITNMIQDLKMDATLDFEKELLSCTGTDMPVTETYMKQLENYHQHLCKKLKHVKEEISNLRIKIDGLWELLDEDIKERDAFRQKYTGNSLETLEALKSELERLEELKKINIKVFIDKRRQDLVDLWEKCHCDGSQKNDFQFLYSISYSEDLLEFHERELEKWTNYYEENKELLALLEKHKTLWEQMLQIESSAESENRYKNRGGALLLEEKARNKLSKKIPELEDRISNLATLFESQKGYPFKTFGRTVDEYLQLLRDKREEERKTKLIAKKSRDITTPAKSCTTLPSTSSRATPHSTQKRHGPLSSQKHKRVLTDKNTDIKNAKSPGKPMIKVAVVNQVRRLSAERRKRVEKTKKPNKKMPLRANHGNIYEDSKENMDDTNSTEYDAFERNLSVKDNCRSTQFQLSSSGCDQSQSGRKRKAETEATKKGSPKTPKIDYLCPPNTHLESVMSQRTPSKLTLYTPSKTPQTLRRTPRNTPSRTPGRTPKTPNTQKLKPAASSLKLIF